jgi:flagellar basal body-associated protein FliL
MAAAGSGKSPSALLQTGLAFLAVTVAAAVGGGMVGYNFLSLRSGETSAAPEVEKPVEGAHAAGHGATDTRSAAPVRLQVRELPPIVTNLARPAKSFVRLQSAIVYDASELPHIEPLVATLMGDITAFLGTLDVASLEGPDGLRRLQEELSERAAIRSERRLREFIIETLVVQ